MRLALISLFWIAASSVNAQEYEGPLVGTEPLEKQGPSLMAPPSDMATGTGSLNISGAAPQDKKIEIPCSKERTTDNIECNGNNSTE